VIYFDTSYVARLYLHDPGWEKVQKLAETGHLACGLHGRAETLAAFHRKLREGAINVNDLKTLLSQFEQECEAGAFRWLPVSEAVIARVARVYSSLPVTVVLRASDAIHLACASEHGLKEIHSNDTRLLAGAIYFGLKGVDVI
jgi:predicted nucleic acid-binding protein